MRLSNIAPPEWKYPELTVYALKEIVKNAVEGTGVKRVGLVGSMARGEHSRVSDVDLLLDSINFSEDLLIFGEYVGSKLDNQYNKRLDIIDFKFASDVAEGTEVVDNIWKHKQGYERMLKEVIWIFG